jgi:hypothetical protein
MIENNRTAFCPVIFGWSEGETSPLKICFEFDFDFDFNKKTFSLNFFHNKCILKNGAV